MELPEGCAPSSPVYETGPSLSMGRKHGAFYRICTGRLLLTKETHRCLCLEGMLKVVASAECFIRGLKLFRLG